MDNDSIVTIQNRAAAYMVHEETLEGRPHLVVPVTILVEGVHQGIGAPPIYYSREFLQRTAPAWNGVPVPVYHPEDMAGNVSFETCNDPSVINRQVVGRLLNAHYTAGKIKGEIWFDADRIQDLAPDVHERILNGDPIEVSTGGYITAIGEGGTWNGEAYDASVQEMRPDHLAVLPNQRGACSVADGCGVRNREAEMNLNVNNPSFEGKEDVPWGPVDKSLGAYIKGYYKHSGASRPDEMPTSAGDLPTAAKRWIASKTLNGKSNATTTSDLISYPVVNPGTNKINRAALIAAKGRATQQGQAAIASKADSLLRSQFEMSNNVLMKIGAMLANQLSLTDKHEKVARALDRMDNVERVHYLEELFDDHVIYRVAQRSVGGDSRFFKADYTINEEDGSVEFGEPVEVRKEVDYVVVNLADCQCNDNTNAGGKKMKKTEKCPIGELIANEGTDWSEDDREELGKIEKPMLERMVKNSAAPVPDPPPAKEGDGDAEPAKPVEKLPELLANASPELRDFVESGMAVNAAHRAKLVERITGVEGNKFTAEVLNGMTTQNLEGIASLIPVANTEGDGGNGGGIYVGAQGSAVPTGEDPDPLPATTMEDIAGVGAGE
jgi:hypothetical protein